MGDKPVSPDNSPSRRKEGGGIRLPGAKAHYPCDEHDDWLQYVTPPVCQHGRLLLYPFWGWSSVVRSGPLSGAGHKRAGIPVSCFDYRSVFRRTVICAGNHWGVSGADALPYDGSPQLRGPRDRKITCPMIEAKEPE